MSVSKPPMSRSSSKVVDAITCGDSRATQMKKLTCLGCGKDYRAKPREIERLMAKLAVRKE